MVSLAQMFSRLLGSVRSIFTWTPSNRVQASGSTVEQQVRVELAEAAEGGMVTTRQQEHSLLETSLVGGLEDVTPKSQSRKRRSVGAVNNTPTENERISSIGTPMKSAPAAKRRRISPSPALPERTSTAEAATETDDAVAKKDSSLEPDNEAVITASLNSSPNPASPAPLPSTRSLATNGHTSDVDMHSKGELENDKMKPSRPCDEDSEEHAQVNPKKKPGTKDIKTGSKLANESSPQSQNALRNDRALTKKPIHKRFGTEEPEVVEELEVNANDENHGRRSRNGDIPNATAQIVDEGSEDDAPETVTASAGQAQAQKAAADEAQAVARESMARKVKRRKRDAHLRKQAELAKQSNRTDAVILPDSDPDITMSNGENVSEPKQSLPPAPNSTIDLNNLPDLLPDYILATEPVIPAVTKPRQSLLARSNKRKFLDVDPKPPKDVKRGSVSVRVLEQTKSILPPKAAKSSKHLKEAWLSGHRGRDGGVASQRRKIGGGFVRK